MRPATSGARSGPPWWCRSRRDPRRLACCSRPRSCRRRTRDAATWPAPARRRRLGRLGHRSRLGHGGVRPRAAPCRRPFQGRCEGPGGSAMRVAAVLEKEPASASRLSAPWLGSRWGRRRVARGTGALAIDGEVHRGRGPVARQHSNGDAHLASLGHAQLRELHAHLVGLGAQDSPRLAAEEDHVASGVGPNRVPASVTASPGRARGG